MFSKNVVKLMAGAGISQAFLILATPLITRMFSVDEFGFWSVFIAIQTVLGSIASFRYEFSIINADDEEQAMSQLGISIFFSFFSSIVTLIAVKIWGGVFANWINLPEFESFLYLVPLVVLFSGVGNGLYFWTSRAGNFGKIAIARIVSSGVLVGSILILGWLTEAGGVVLIASTVAGSVMFALLLMLRFWGIHDLLPTLHWKRMWFGIRYFKKYPLFDIPSGLLNTLSWQLPSFVLARYFSVEAVGYFGLAMRVVFSPFSLIGTSVAQVFFQEAEQKKKDGLLAPMVEDVTYTLILVAVCPVVVLMVSGQEIFTVIFGSNWVEAGRYAQLLGLWTLFVFISSPLHGILNTLGRQEVGLGFNVALLGTRILSIIVGVMVKDARIAIALFSITGVICYAAIALWILKACNVSVKKITGWLFEMIYLSAMILVALLPAKMFWAESPALVVLASLILLALYYVVLVLTKPTLRSKLFSMVGGFGKWL